MGRPGVGGPIPGTAGDRRRRDSPIRPGNPAGDPTKPAFRGSTPTGRVQPRRRRSTPDSPERTRMATAQPCGARSLRDDQRLPRHSVRPVDHWPRQGRPAQCSSDHRGARWPALLRVYGARVSDSTLSGRWNVAIGYPGRLGASRIAPGRVPCIVVYGSREEAMSIALASVTFPLTTGSSPVCAPKTTGLGAGFPVGSTGIDGGGFDTLPKGNVETIDIARFRSGDPTAFRTVVEQCGPLIRSMVASYVRDPDDRDDLYQEICIRVWEYRAQFSGRDLSQDGSTRSLNVRVTTGSRPGRHGNLIQDNTPTMKRSERARTSCWRIRRNSWRARIS